MLAGLNSISTQPPIPISTFKEWFGASLSADTSSILQNFKRSIPILAHLFKSKNLRGLVGKSSLAPYRHYTLSKPKDHSLHALK
jgi:hypothetical protein